MKQKVKCLGDLEKGETDPSTAESRWLKEGFVEEVTFALSPGEP